MNAATLIAECRAAGLEVFPRGEKLVVRPAEKLTPDLRERLVAAKPELLAALAWDAQADAVLAAMYQRVAAAFEVRPWAIPGRGDDAHQAAIEAACQARDIDALRRAAERYVESAERFAAELAKTVRSATEAR